MVRYFLASIVVAVVLASCGSDAAGDDHWIGADEQSSATVAPVIVESPLESELDFASEPERRRHQLITRQRTADAGMVQCMQQAGFFYAVSPAEDAFRSGAIVGDGSREWAQINGLGITSSFIEALAVDGAQASPDAAQTNLAYVASLSAEQQLDYDRALIGGLLEDPDAQINATPGCFERSYNDIIASVGLIEAFAPELASLNSRLSSDPRVLGFQQQWSACMAAAGYSYKNEDALVDDVYARLLEIELVDANGVMQVVSPDALDELLIFERAAAAARLDCRLGFVDELAQLRYDYEREFLDDNRFRIAEIQAPS